MAGKLEPQARAIVQKMGELQRVPTSMLMMKAGEIRQVLDQSANLMQQMAAQLDQMSAALLKLGTETAGDR